MNDQSDRTTVSQAARRLNLNKGTVSRQAKQFGLDKDREGRFDFAAFVQARADYVNEARSGSHAGRLLGDGAAPPAGPPPPANGVKAGDALSYRKAKTAREGYAAGLARLDYEKRTGLLVEKAHVIDAMMAGARRIRQGLDALPAEADALAAAALAGGANAVRASLRELVRKIETGIAEALSLDAALQDAEPEPAAGPAPAAEEIPHDNVPA